MTSDRISGTSNQIPASTDEIKLDVNHSGNYKTQNSQHTLCVRIYISIMWCQKKVNKERDKRKHRSQEKFTHSKQIDVYGSLLEGKRHQSLPKPGKIKFSNEPKQTELAKQKHDVNAMPPKYV